MQTDQDRRRFLGKALYAAPAIATLKVTPSFAQSASHDGGSTGGGTDEGGTDGGDPGGGI